MGNFTLVLLSVVMTIGLALGHDGNHTINKRGKRELLLRSKRRWVLSTIELVEEDTGVFPKMATQMFNDQTAHMADHKFRITGTGVTEDPLGVFSINSKNGVVMVHMPIDREKHPFFHIKFDILDIRTGKPVDRTLAFDVDIMDINDNAPKFDHPIMKATVQENLVEGYLPVSLVARDMDKEGTENSTITMTVLSQVPAEPKISMLQVAGTKISQLTFAGCFNYDKIKKYKIIVEAKDHGKPPLSSTATVNLFIEDSNTHAPVFKEPIYHAEMWETDINREILRLGVTDGDTPNTPAWNAKYTILKGNEEGNYKIDTDPKTNEGILVVIKGKDFEKTTFTNVTIAVENAEPLFVCGASPGTAPRVPGAPAPVVPNPPSVKPPPPNTVTVAIKVIDANDPPKFDKVQKDVYAREEEEPGMVIYKPIVTDVDSDVDEIRFELNNDTAEWLAIDEKTGVLTSVKKMDRESPHVDKNNMYTVYVKAIDNGEPPCTATATVLIHVGDVNDNLPNLVHKSLIMCGNKVNRIAVPAEDADDPPFAGPFSFLLGGEDKTIRTTWKLDPDSGMEAGLVSLRSLAYGNYTVPLVIRDQQGMIGPDSLVVVVCDCAGGDECRGKLPATASMGSAAIGLLLIGLLLVLLLLCLLMICNCPGKKFSPIMADEGNQTLIKYNEEGGGSACRSDPVLILTPTQTQITVTDAPSQKQSAMPIMEMSTQDVDETRYESGRMPMFQTQMFQTQVSSGNAGFSGMGEANGSTRMGEANGSMRMGEPNGTMRMGEANGTMRMGEPTRNMRMGEANATMSRSHGGRDMYSTWTTTRTNTNRNQRGASRFSRSFSMMADQKIAEHIDRRLFMIGGYGGEERGNVPVDQPYEYTYEGKGSKCLSLDELSLSDPGEDLLFLEDLGSKFNVLRDICHEDMQERNLKW